MKKLPTGSICYRCENKAEKRERDKDGIFTGNYICKNCYQKDYWIFNKDRINKDRRSLAQCRNGELSPYSNIGKGYIFEQIICITLGLNNCNIEKDNWNSPIDIDKHEKYGYISCKGANIRYGEWHFTNIRRCIVRKKFDTLILICMSKDRKNVERVYVIPIEETIGRDNITIYDNPSRSAWYEKYRIDETPFNNTYHNMSLKNCNVLKDINKYAT